MPAGVRHHIDGPQQHPNGVRTTPPNPDSRAPAVRRVLRVCSPSLAVARLLRAARSPTCSPTRAVPFRRRTADPLQASLVARVRAVLGVPGELGGQGLLLFLDSSGQRGHVFPEDRVQWGTVMNAELWIMDGAAKAVAADRAPALRARSQAVSLHQAAPPHPSQALLRALRALRGERRLSAKRIERPANAMTWSMLRQDGPDAGPRRKRLRCRLDTARTRSILDSRGTSWGLWP